MDESSEDTCKECGGPIVLDEDVMTLEPCDEPDRRVAIVGRRCRRCGLVENRIEYPDGRVTTWKRSLTA
jgi:hypothetical protein